MEKRLAGKATFSFARHPSPTSTRSRTRTVPALAERIMISTTHVVFRFYIPFTNFKERYPIHLYASNSPIVNISLHDPKLSFQNNVSIIHLLQTKLRAEHKSNDR